MPNKRRSVPIYTQVSVFFRDKWLCHWCHRPLVFAPSLRCLEALVRSECYEFPVSYFDLRWRRDRAPLLDELGAVIDHVEAHATGGADAPDNLVAACNKCNARKSSSVAADYIAKSHFRTVKSHYGDPEQWDGLVSLFITYARKHPGELSAQDKAWFRSIELYLQRAHDQVVCASV